MCWTEEGSTFHAKHYRLLWIQTSQLISLMMQNTQLSQSQSLKLNLITTKEQHEKSKQPILTNTKT